MDVKFSILHIFIIFYYCFMLILVFYFNNDLCNLRFINNINKGCFNIINNLLKCSCINKVDDNL
jgi:hypothetical protein